jgi:hypothetical protein
MPCTVKANSRFVKLGSLSLKTSVQRVILAAIYWSLSTLPADFGGRRMLNQRTTLVFLLTVCSIFLGVTAVAQSPKEAKKKIVGPIAEVTSDRTEIQWRPHVEYESLVLTVSRPDGEVVRLEFESGRAPFFKLNDEDGAPLPNGHYRYELRLTPNLDGEVKDSLKAAEAEGNRDRVERALKKSGKLPSEPLIQYGTFMLEKGKLYIGSASEGETPQRISSNLQDYSAPPREELIYFKPVKAAFRPFDQVIPDDLIVQGSACAGLDCVNNENFGFDTIRLKENNLRIHFDDTSTSAGFPANDWRLVANDSASGGSSKFSIEDSTGAKTPFTITAGASTNSIFVDSTGRVGFRTSTPVLDLHTNTSNTPAIRLEQNNSGGFTAQTWDIGANEANFFVRDVTGGSKLSLRIRPGAPTSSLDISADGDVGMGTGSPQNALEVRRDRAFSTSADITRVIANNANATGLAAFSLFSDTSEKGRLQYNNSSPNIFLGSVGGIPLHLGTNEAIRLTVSGTGAFLGIGQTSPTSPIHHSSGAVLTAGGVWTNASSKALKTNIRSLSARDAFVALQRMNPVTFQYKADPAEKHVGFIAEEVPELVATTDRKGLSAMDVVAVLTKVVQEQQQIIADLKVKVDHIEKVQAKKTRRLKKK